MEKYKTLKDAMVGAGIPLTDASIIDDLSDHALHEIMATIDRICGTAPEHLRGPVFDVTIKKIAVNFGTASAELEKGDGSLERRMEAMAKEMAPAELEASIIRVGKSFGFMPPTLEAKMKAWGLDEAMIARVKTAIAGAS